MIATRTARAVWFPSPRTVEFREEPLPEVGPGDVRVRSLVSGISHGTEMLVYRGEVAATTALDLSTLRGAFGFPIKYGYASVGRVVETGAAVSTVTPGDLAFVHHPHQSEYVVDAGLAVRLPPDVTPELGVLTANLETAVNIALDAHPRLGDRLVVVGQGVVGLLAAAVLRRAGAARIIVVDAVERRRSTALELGADDAIEPGPDLAAAVRSLTAGVGADIVVEASGNPAALQAAIDCVRLEGTVVVSSWYGTKPVALQLGGNFHRGRVRMLSSQVGRLDPALGPGWDVGRRRELALDLLAELHLERLVTHRFAFDRAAEAYALLDERGGETIQTVLVYDGDA